MVAARHTIFQTLGAVIAAQRWYTASANPSMLGCHPNDHHSDVTWGIGSTVKDGALYSKGVNKVRGYEPKFDCAAPSSFSFLTK